jgi:hypothetical protein
MGKREKKMRLFKGLFDIVIGTPVAIIKDVVTLGGLVTEEDKSYTQQQAEKIDDDIRED